MQFYQVAIVFAVAFVVTYAMVPVCKGLAQVLGAIDYPGNRRVNTQPVPRCGGIALYVGLCAGAFTIVLGYYVFGWNLSNLYVLSNIDYRLLFVGVSAMFGVGLIDDIIQLKSAPKFGLQIVAATIVALSGVTIGTVRLLGTSSYLVLYWLDIPLTVFYLLVFVNITNLIDGLDGLASGLVAIVSASLLYMVLMRGFFSMALLIVALIACCLAFLRFNFFPASIFMGDSGSHLLGIMLGVVSIVGVVRAQGIATMLVPLVLAGVPVLDTLSAIVRRLRAHTPVGKGDADHIHHKLLHSGLSQRRTVAMLWLCTAGLAVAGILVENMTGWARFAVIAVLAVVVFFIIWKYGLFQPVLKHHYDNAGKSGPRRPRGEGAGGEAGAGAFAGAGSLSGAGAANDGSAAAAAATSVAAAPESGVRDGR